MAEVISASIIPLHQPRPKTGAERSKAYRDRKRVAPAALPVLVPVATSRVTPVTRAVTSRVTPVTLRTTSPVTLLLHFAAFGLGAVGITMNGWFARSLGSTDMAGWLFLAIGVAADGVALALPSIATSAWNAHRRGSALTAWSVWAVTFAFAITAGIGFASLNISDVTTARQSRVTPAVTSAQAALSDAMAARDRECGHGVGKFCREREAVVAERRNALDAAAKGIAQTADPQTEAATKIVAWVSFGFIRPSGDDFAMLRLILLALLPQIGGVLLMVGRKP
jgi:hypothetical protein